MAEKMDYMDRHVGCIWGRQMRVHTVLLAAMKLLPLCMGTFFSFGFVLPVVAQEKPTLPHLDWGSCPFECCTYREWIATAPIKVFKSRDKNSAIAFQLHAGEKALALTGVIVTHKLGVTEITKPIEVGYLPKGRKPMLSLKPKDVVYTLHYAGEGNDVFWYNGKTYQDQIAVPDNAMGDAPNSETFKVLSRPEYDWWAKVRNNYGQTGWTRETKKFENQDACG